jgi:hypothetical protein
MEGPELLKLNIWSVLILRNKPWSNSFAWPWGQVVTDSSMEGLQNRDVCNRLEFPWCCSITV